MLRYLRLYGYFLRFSFSKAMEFRFDFFFRVVMDMIWYAVQFAFVEVIYLHTPAFGGLDLDQIYVFLGALFITDALHMTIFSNNLWYMPFLVNKGDLDYYLVRPVAPLFFLTLREFAANSFLNLLMAAGFLGWALARYPGGLHAGFVLAFVLLLGIGLVVHVLLELLSIIPVFWLHAGMGLREVHFSLSESANRPHRIYRGWVRRAVTTLLPYALIASVPVQGLFAASPRALLGITAHAGAVALGLGAFVLWFWRRALRAYASASS